MKVNSLIFFLLLILHFACSNKNQTSDYKNYYDKTIPLTELNINYQQQDTLAILTMKIPHKLDSFYQWHNTSDCTNCGWLQYRFANSSYPKYLESGFFWNEPFPDSIYQLTLRHKPIRSTPDSVKLKPLSPSDSTHSELPIREILCKESQIISIEYAVINNRSFWITQVSNACSPITNKNSIYVAAITNLDDRWLEIIGECSAKDTIGFRGMIYNSIKSIKIVKKQ
jgi:hypothetical protein